MFFFNIYRNFCVPAFILDKGLVGYKVKFYRMGFCVIAGNFYSLLSHSVEEMNQVLAQCVLEKAVSIWIFHWNVLLFVLSVICCSTLENVRIFTPARLFCPKQKLYIFGNFRTFGFFWDVSFGFFWYMRYFLSDFVQFTDQKKWHHFSLIVAVLDFVERSYSTH